MRTWSLGHMPASRSPSNCELAVHAEHELARHADLDAQPRVLLAQHATGGEAGEEVGVAGRAGRVEVDAVGAGLDHVVGDEVDVVDEHLDGLFLGRAGLVDLAQRQQLGPVGDGSVGLRVAAQVGHRAVLHGVGAQHLGDLHGLPLVGDVGLDRLVGVVDLPELDDVDAEHLLERLQVLHAVADVLGPRAVVAHDDLVADVDGGEARRRGVDVEQVVELVLGERVALGPLGRLLRAVFEIGLDLGAGHLDERTVTHASRDLGFQAHHLHCFARARRRATAVRPGWGPGESTTSEANRQPSPKPSVHRTSGPTGAATRPSTRELKAPRQIRRRYAARRPVTWLTPGS